jgi:ubiquinone/menaquinone biosynthesis C-methylase UbiE
MQAKEAASQVSPFDAIAERYDNTFSSSIIGRLQRQSVWDELTKSFRPGDRVLDIGCGTGVDACFLAEHGVHVTACDNSAKMLRVAERRIAALPPTTGSIQLRAVAAEQISILNTEGPFDGAVSNFGAINCLPDIAKLAADLALLVRPGARVFLCLIGPVCIWETFWYLLHGKPAKGFRRFRQNGVPAKLQGGSTFEVYYRSASAIETMFKPQFRLKAIRGIGLVVPPSYVEGWAQRFPSLLRLAATADRFLASCPGIRGVADHMLLQFECTGHDAS